MRTLATFRLWTAARAGLLLLIASACHGKSVTDIGFADGSARVLFVGNSLTYSNSLPAMFISLARLAGDNAVNASSVAFPNFGLEDHWAEGTARRSLSEHKWEYVVMQQGSSALPESQINLRKWTQQFAPLIRAAGAEPVLFMVWPTSTRLFDFPNVLNSYRDAAAMVNGIFAPSGDAWSAYNNMSVVYSSDGLHPSVYGTYVSALVLLERVRGIRPDQLPVTIPGYTTNETIVRDLQAAARVALDRNPAKPNRVLPQ